MRLLSVILVTWFALLSCFTIATANADKQGGGSSFDRIQPGISSDPTDPSNTLPEITKRRSQRDSLLPVSPLKPLHNTTKKMWDAIYEPTHLRLGWTFNNLFQWLSDAIPDTDKYGVTTDSDLVGSWELLNRGEPTQGNLYVKAQGRWDYGTTGPQTLGFVNLATAGGTANSFSEYDPAVLLRDLYWEQGSQEAGWIYRLGKITTDGILATSKHITPVTTFLPNAGTGLFSSGYPDSGLGITGVWYPSDRYRFLGLVSDANGDRYNWGDISEGDLYTAFEFGVRIAPKTKKAGFSKFTVWHNDGTEDGQPINAMTGAEGWGMTVKLEQELTDDGNVIGIIRYGKSWRAAIYDQQAAGHLLFYEPFGTFGLKHDLIGFAVNWVDSFYDDTRDEYNLEAFYRFPLFPGLDARLSYQYVIDPAFTREFDSASVFSFGFRTVF